jgi:Fic family protein
MQKIPGVYKQSSQTYRTFYPNPLPPPLTLSAKAQRVVEEATHLLGQVEMCRTLLPNANLLVYSSLQREALASSTIEGTITSPDALIRYQVGQHPEDEVGHEVANYSQALTWGCDQLPKRPIAYVLIVGLHEQLLHGVRGSGAIGRLKDRQNRIGSDPREPIEAAVFIPPSPDDTVQLLGDLEQYINNQDNKEARVVQCALVHYQFETIHPFNDGNGRVGRLLIILHMMQLGLLSAPLIYPSVYFERQRSAYYDHLQAVRDKAAWHEWIEFFAQGIVDQCHETIAFTRTILALQDSLQSKAGIRKRATTTAVLNAFFNEPVLSVTAVAEQAHISYNSAQAVIAELEKGKIVRELTGKQKGRIFACDPVLDAIFNRNDAFETT